MEDLGGRIKSGQAATTSQPAVGKEDSPDAREMLTPALRANLSKQGYKLIGDPREIVCLTACCSLESFPTLTTCSTVTSCAAATCCALPFCIRCPRDVLTQAWILPNLECLELCSLSGPTCISGTASIPAQRCLQTTQNST